MMLYRSVKIATGILLREKGYVATYILSIGITLGVLIAIFNLNYQILVGGMPYDDSDRIVVSRGSSFSDGKLDLEDTIPNAALPEIYLKHAEKFEEVSMVSFDRDIIRDLPSTPRVNTTFSTPEYHSMIGLKLLKGRQFSESENFETKNPVAIISSNVWIKYYGSDPDILGKYVTFGEQSFKIIGVSDANALEPEITQPGWFTDVWLPYDYNPVMMRFRYWNMAETYQYLFAKLKSSEQRNSLSQIISEIVNKRFKEETAGISFFADLTVSVELESLRTRISGDTSKVSMLMFAGAAILLIIACANVVNLVSARMINQQRNLAIRAAIGAQKSHLFVNVLVELLVLAVGTIVLSLVVAQAGYEILELYGSEFFPNLRSMQLDIASFSFCLAVLATISIVFAFIAIKSINYRKLQMMLQSGGKGTGVQTSKRVRWVLIASQITFIGVLLFTCLQVLFNSYNILQLKPNFDTESLYEVNLNEIYQTEPSTQEERRSYYQERRNYLSRIVEILEDDFRVETASVSSNGPITRLGIYWTSYLASDASYKEQYGMRTTLVDEKYLPMLETNIIQGRFFTKKDSSDKSPFIIINETAAHKLGGVETVLGKRYHWLNGNQELQYEVIGVVSDFNIPGQDEVARMWSVQGAESFPNFLIKFKPGQSMSPAEINAVIGSVTAIWRLDGLESISENVSLSLASYKIAAVVAVALSLVSLGLSFIGLFGVFSYDVRLRRFELGVRMSVGATPLAICHQLFRDNLSAVSAGLAISCLILASIWAQTKSFNFEYSLSVGNIIIPLFLISATVVFSVIFSLWGIIRKQPIDALRDH